MGGSMSIELHRQRRTSVLMFCACFAFGGTVLQAQTRTQLSFNRPLATRAGTAIGTSAFLVEAAGAAAGSAVGFGVLYLTASECDVEDLGCTLEKVFTGIALGTAAAAAGAVLA